MRDAVNSPVAPDPASIATITVTYNADLEILWRQQAQLAAASLRILVDNASIAASHDRLRALADAAGAELIVLPVNIGLAAAINIGLRRIRERGLAIRAILLLDQDTEPGPNGLHVLQRAHDALQSRFGSDIALNPALIDADTGLDHGFHVIRGPRWSRIRRLDDRDDPVACASLNCSGTFASTAVFDRVGGMDESFFLDMLDAEWSFRAAASGVRLLGVPAAHFTHRMGQRGLRVWLFGWRVFPYRSPWRNRLVVRNTLRLLGRRYAPAVWKLWALPKLLLTFGAHALFDRDRGAQLRAMLRGAGDALLGRPVAVPPRDASA